MANLKKTNSFDDFGVDKKKANSYVRNVLLNAQNEVFQTILHNPTVKKAFVKTLLDMGMTTREIQQFVKISSKTVSDIRNNYDIDEDLNNALQTSIASVEVGRIQEAKSKMLDRINSDEIINKASLSTLVYAWSTLFEKQRLLENKSTENLAVLVKSLKQDFSDEAKAINAQLQGIESRKPKVKQEFEKNRLNEIDFDEEF
jgi:DNA-binding transcriptional MerR regulator